MLSLSLTASTGAFWLCVDEKACMSSQVTCTKYWSHKSLESTPIQGHVTKGLGVFKSSAPFILLQKTVGLFQTTCIYVSLLFKQQKKLLTTAKNSINIQKVCLNSFSVSVSTKRFLVSRFENNNVWRMFKAGLVIQVFVVLRTKRNGWKGTSWIISGTFFW